MLTQIKQLALDVVYGESTGERTEAKCQLSHRGINENAPFTMRKATLISRTMRTRRPTNLSHNTLFPGYRGSAQWLCEEQGMITWATLLAVVLFVALIGIVFNVGRISNDKLEAQNAADSAAYSASLVQARAMNAVTTTNHMMGELTALYTMHHALGGETLDRGRSKGNYVEAILSAGVGVGFAAAGVAYGLSIPVLAFPAVPVGLPSPPAYFGPAMDTPRGEATIYDAKCLLKEKIIEQYIKHISATSKIVSGAGMTWSIWPPTVAAGWAKIADGQLGRAEANQEIRALVKEYNFINQIEQFAINTRTIKKSIPLILDALWLYERIVVSGTGISSNLGAQSAATANMCVGEVLGRPSLQNIALAQGGIPSATLPLEKDPTNDDERTQYLRATYPWVQEWRWPILAGFGIVVPKSRAMIYYEYHCDQYSKEICHDFRNDRGYELFVIEEMNATRGQGKDKGTEKWRLRSESSLADQMFAVVGLARKQAAPSMSHHKFLLPITNPTPIMAMSQAMIYNGNRPEKWERKTLDYISWRLGREAQPVSGWDTLAWTAGATEWKNGKVYFIFGDDWNWVMGRVPALAMDIVFPPDIKLPPIPNMDGIGPPAPKVKLNWQAKLSPIASRNLAKRLLMTQDASMSQRMQQQVLPTLLAEELGGDFVTH